MAYFLTCFLIIGALVFIGRYQEKSDIRDFSNQLKISYTKLSEEENRISESLVANPTSEAEYDYNLKKLSELLVLIEQRHELQRSMTKFLIELSERKNDQELREKVKKLELILGKNYILARETNQTLINHYETGDNELWEAYVRKLTELENNDKNTKKMMYSILSSIL